MNCKDVDRALGDGLRLPPQVEAHVKSCNRCQELTKVLNMSAPVEAPSPVILRQIAEGIATNLRPVHPVAPPRSFFGAFIGIFACIVAFGVYRIGAFAVAVMTPLQTVAMLGTLAISTGLLAYSLVHQMVPGSHHTIPPRFLPVGIAILLTIAIVLLFEFQREQNFWTNSWACIRAGTPVGALAAAPFWLVLRRGAVLTQSMTGAATGLLAGLVGTTVLEMHCPNLDAWHILVSHLGVAILCAVVGLLTGLTAEFIGRRSSQPPRM